MKLVIITDGLGMHVYSTADQYYKILGKDFVYISAKKPTGEGGIHKFGEMGKKYERPYLFNAWESEENQKKAKQIVDEADVVIAGGYAFPYIQDRLIAGKLTFQSGERWLKKIILSPRGYLSVYKTLFKYQNPNFYFLSNGAYGPNDCKRLHIFNDRVYKGAYMVPVEQYDSQTVVLSRHNEKVEIMWCARFLGWKHPELVVQLSERLQKAGYDNFHITMLGANNPLQDKIKNRIKKSNLENVITIIEGLPNSETRAMMRRSDIFLVTSDRQEGWGAVVNEAMAESCAIVACDEVGSVPFLIKHRNNGLIFKARNAKSLFENVKDLMDNVELRHTIAINAYETISTEWSSENYATRMAELSSSILSGNPIEYSDGPVSKANYCVKRDLIR